MSSREFSDEHLERVLHAAFNQCEFAGCCAKDAVYKMKEKVKTLEEKYCAEHYLWELQHSHSPERIAEETVLITNE